MARGRITSNIFTEEEKEDAKQKKIADMETTTANAIVKSITDKYGFENEHFCNGHVNGFKFQFGKYEIDIILPDSLAMKWKDEQPEAAEVFYLLSTEEMGHADKLHEVVAKLIGEYRDKNGEPPAGMMMLYNYLHEKQIATAMSIKVKQGMYKEA